MTALLRFLADEVAFRGRGPETLIHYVTSRCNARCEHCYFLTKLNAKTDLTREETFHLIPKLGRLRALLVAGGEPFLCDHLADLLAEYHHGCGVRFAQIPTLGYHHARIHRCLETVAKTCPALDLTVNVSLDGFQPFHDANRKVKGAFDRAVETVRMLVAWRAAAMPRLRVNVVSVLMPATMRQLRPLAEWLRDEVGPDLHILEIVREKDFHANNGARAEVESLVEFWKGLTRAYYAKPTTCRNLYLHPWLRRLVGEFAVLNLETAARNFLDAAAWPAPCQAGRKIAVLYPEGDLAVCELRGRLLNVKDHGLDVRAALQTETFQAEVAQVATDQCWQNCTHGCFIPPSIRHAPSQLLKIAWRALRPC